MPVVLLNAETVETVTLPEPPQRVDVPVPRPITADVFANETTFLGTANIVLDVASWRLTGYDVSHGIDGSLFLVNRYMTSAATNAATMTQTFRSVAGEWEMTGTAMEGFQRTLRDTYLNWNPMPLAQRDWQFTTAEGTWRAWHDYSTRSPEEVAKEKRRAARAQGRARRLLKEHLTDDENEQLAAHGYFEIESLTTGRRYRVYRGVSRNIVELDEAGVPVARLCAHGVSSARMPQEDHMLAQKLWLQAMEDDFRKIANISRIGKVEARQLLGPDGSVLLEVAA